MQILWVHGRIAAMEDPKWFRMITIGLVLVALSVGYFLLTGGFSVSKSKKVVESPAPNPTSTPSPTPQSAYNAIVNRTQSGVQTLPNTGFPASMLVVFSAGAVVAGWGLRRFPH